MTESRPLPFPAVRRGQVASLDAQATIPEEDICSPSRKVGTSAAPTGSTYICYETCALVELGRFSFEQLDGEPRTFRIEKLIASAASGGEAAILDQLTKNRADGLVQTRQRIHAGRMLADFPGGAPDLKPEQARDANPTAELVVRKVIEWLEKNRGP